MLQLEQATWCEETCANMSALVAPTCRPCLREHVSRGCRGRWPERFSGPTDILSHQPVWTQVDGAPCPGNLFSVPSSRNSVTVETAPVAMGVLPCRAASTRSM
eukprot:366174-Chlamydomonas_euryale.AAC.4